MAVSQTTLAQAGRVPRGTILVEDTELQHVPRVSFAAPSTEWMERKASAVGRQWSLLGRHVPPTAAATLSR